MPFTAYHIGPSLFLGLLLLDYIDFPTIILASAIVDIEPLFVRLFDLNYPVHGFFHTLLGGTLVAILLTLIMYKIRPKFSGLLSLFKLEQKISLQKIVLASVAGIYIHIFLDSQIYFDIKPFYPFTTNPLLTTQILPGIDPWNFCIWSYVGAAIIYIIRLYIIQKNKKTPKINQNY